MNSQPKWDIYESVVLLNGYLLACKKSEPRAYIIRRVSADLRAMAIHRGRKIDEIFRNENGISYQMQSMDSAYKGRKIYVPATKLFQETVSLYRNQNSRFQELLKEARYMIEHDIAHPALNDTDVFVVDFNDCPDMSFARVNSLTYRGQAILIRPKWRDLYIALLKKLYADYSNEIDSVVGKVYGRASAPFVGNCHSISLMRSPGEFAPDRYVELNISATTVIVNIKTMLDICGTSYEDVNITYTKGNKDQMEALLKVQNIRTVFSAELLSIAGTIISDIFPNGLRKSSQIARKKFAAAYKNTTGRDFQDNIDLDALALQVGLEYEDKIYVPSKETKEFLKKLIDNIREQEYRLVYYEELYNAFSEQLSADKIFSAEMLKTVLEAVAPEMVFYKAYACFSKNDSLVDDIIRAYGNDIYIDYHEIKSRLPYVDLYQIRLTCSRSPEFVSMGDEVYALSGKIYLSKNDVEAARRSIEEDITENNFSKLGSIDVYESECMNPGINASALQTLLFDRYLSEDYDRKRSIITRKGAEVRVYDVMKEFCLEHEQISVNEIEAYERDISGRFTYGLSAAFDNMIRVDKETFVHNDMVSFDVEAIDYAISMYVQNSVVPLADIKSFTSFPYVEDFPWNSFLLDSFCSHYSKEFRSMGGPAKQDIIGAIYPIHMTFDNYTSLLAKAAAGSGLELTEKTIGDFFSAHKYWLRRSKLNEVLATAQEMRLKEE